MLGCDAGHRLDANRRGYLTAIDQSAGIAGDTREILEARSQFLDLGYYQPIMDAVARSIPPSPSTRVLDAGSGTGHYLAHVLSAGSDRRGLALDASIPAVAASVGRAHSPGLVADTWKPLSVRTARADVILCVFAPRNAPEFARILSATGRLVVVTPGPAHLIELREAGLAIGMQPDKLSALDVSLRPAFDREARTRVTFPMELSGEDAALITGMGPTGHHHPTGAWLGGSVTADIDVTVWHAGGMDPGR